MKPARELFATAVGSTTVIVVGVTAWCLVLPLGVTVKILKGVGRRGGRRAGGGADTTGKGETERRRKVKGIFV